MLTKAHIKFINELRQKKAIREEHGLFVAEGPKVVEELLRAENIDADEIFATDEWLAENHNLAQSHSRFLMEVNDRELERISGLKTPNQVVGIFHKPDFPWTRKFDGQVSILLDSIQDPGNLGTIIRTADWFGVKLIVCSPTCADAFGPKVVQSTMGSLGRVQVIYQELTEFLTTHSHMPVYAAALDGESVHTVPPLESGFMLIGNESRGISRELLEKAQRRITIPRIGQAESLNAAVATGIILSRLKS